MSLVFSWHWGSRDNQIGTNSLFGAVVHVCGAVVHVCGAVMHVCGIHFQSQFPPCPVQVWLCGGGPAAGCRDGHHLQCQQGLLQVQDMPGAGSDGSLLHRGGGRGQRAGVQPCAFK